MGFILSVSRFNVDVNRKVFIAVGRRTMRQKRVPETMVQNQGIEVETWMNSRE